MIATCEYKVRVYNNCIQGNYIVLLLEAISQLHACIIKITFIIIIMFVVFMLFPSQPYIGAQ